MHLHNVSDWQSWLRNLGLVAVHQLYKNVFVVEMFYKIASNNHLLQWAKHLSIQLAVKALII